MLLSTTVAMVFPHVFAQRSKTVAPKSNLVNGLLRRPRIHKVPLPIVEKYPNGHVSKLQHVVGGVLQRDSGGVAARLIQQVPNFQLEYDNLFGNRYSKLQRLFG